MRSPWTLLDYNYRISRTHGIKFRPIDIFDADEKFLFRISDGEEGVKLAHKIVACINDEWERKILFEGG